LALRWPDPAEAWMVSSGARAPSSPGPTPIARSATPAEPAISGRAA